MDRRQMLVQRTREYLADRLTDVLLMVQQDRQEMRGWQEPSHLRATLRRTAREQGANNTTTTSTTETTDAMQMRQMEQEFGRNAGEPERGQQREAVGLLLEAGANALERMTRNATDFTTEELAGLEAVLLLYARPALLVSEGRMSTVPAFWNLIEDQREEIELAQRGVGRIEMLGHPEYDWAGTGFLVSDNVLMTTRRIAELFAENRGTTWQFRPGISAWMDYRSTQSVSTAGYRVRRVLGAHNTYDMALLEVEGTQLNGNAPTPLSLAGVAPQNLEGRPAYLIGYPCRDSRRNESETMSRIFRDVYNVKRVQPGCVRGNFRFNEIELMRHDCAPLGQNPGAPILDLETHQVIGMQVSGRYLENNTAIPMWALRDDPLLQQAGVTFAAANAEEREELVQQLERLSRSRYWTETRSTIETLYRKAFGYEAR